MHDHGVSAAAAWVAPEGLALIVLLFLTGLWGGLTHCAGMCGPFVLTQIDQRLESIGIHEFGRWSRLRGAALVPYHLGRMTTYAALGAAAGSVGALFVATTNFRWILAVFLLVAAGIFAAQAFGLPALGALKGPPILSRVIGRLARNPSPIGRYALGLALGFLPCGLLYGALAAAAAAGDPVSGAIGMIAFAVGTAPALIAVGWGGVLLGGRRRQTLQRLTRPMLVFNALLLAVLALSAAS